MRKPRVVLAGIIGRYPLGGVTWCALQYIAGLQDLGYEVFYLEDTGECGFDPVTNGLSTDPSYAVRYIAKELALVNLEENWSYIDYRGTYHGRDRSEVVPFCETADVMINLSGGTWFDRPEYTRMRRIFIDTDPGFTQRAIAEDRSNWYREFFASHDHLFTFALNINDADCSIAPTPFTWKPTVQPVVMRFWPIEPPPPEAAYTTILSWRIDSFPGMGKGKASEVLRLLDLPRESGRRLLLAIAGQPPRDLLNEHGWQLTDAVETTSDATKYREFIQSSKAELGLAKAMYVETNSGWVSDRTQAYLASGRPAVVRETGLSKKIPVGAGLHVFRTSEDILDAMAHVEGNYERESARAREIAGDCFSASTVLADLLAHAGVR